MWRGAHRARPGRPACEGSSAMSAAAAAAWLLRGRAPQSASCASACRGARLCQAQALLRKCLAAAASAMRSRALSLAKWPPQVAARPTAMTRNTRRRRRRPVKCALCRSHNEPTTFAKLAGAKFEGAWKGSLSRRESLFVALRFDTVYN